MNDIPADIPTAPAWSLFIGALGKGCIWSAIVLFALAALLWILRPRMAAMEAPAKLAFAIGSLCLFGAFGCLAALFIKDQFQFRYVFEHGDASTDLKYKLAGVWTAQEGSFLLWACTSALFGLLTIRGTGPYRRWYTVVYSGFLACLSAILAYETPFDLLKNAQAHGKIFALPNGQGMTPSLQNYWVVIHPPTIFLGFGSLTVFFAYAAAAMLERNAGDWIPRVRPWALVTTAILGLGICMGGLWAYDTQGWGGFWAWDPVEIASFVPWLFTVVFVHGILVQVTRRQWTMTNLLLGGLPFLTFVYGTFLTRSGLLDKVSLHSFATMDTHALVILRWFMIAVVVAYAVLFAATARRAASAVPAPDPDDGAVHRESFYRFGMLLISMLGIVLALGMSWPVIAALRGGEGSKVEEWLYHLVVVWFFLPVTLLMAVAPFVSWRSMGWRALGNRLFTVICISIGLTGFIQMGLMSPSFGVHSEPGATVAGPFGYRVALPFWMLLLVFLCLFVMVANIWRISEIVRRSPMGIGGFLAHLGLAILMGGLIISRGYEQKETVFLRQGSPPVNGLGYWISYRDKTHGDPFDRDGKVFFDVAEPNGSHFVASPGLYEYGPSDNPDMMVWPHVQRYLSHDVYLSMAPPEFKAWKDPVILRPGESRTVDGSTIEYLSATREGQLGAMGVTFGAKVRFTTEGDDGEPHQYLANPSVKLTSDGLQPSLERVGPDYLIAMIGGMNASDRSVQLMLFFSPPIYPITIYYKPLTGLVWLGAIVMTGGGLMSAWSRRRVKVREPQRGAH